GMINITPYALHLHAVGANEQELRPRHHGHRAVVELAPGHHACLGRQHLTGSNRQTTPGMGHTHDRTVPADPLQLCPKVLTTRPSSSAGQSNELIIRRSPVQARPGAHLCCLPWHGLPNVPWLCGCTAESLGPILDRMRDPARSCEASGCAADGEASSVTAASASKPNWRRRSTTSSKRARSGCTAPGAPWAPRASPVGWRSASGSWAIWPSCTRRAAICLPGCRSPSA